MKINLLALSILALNFNVALATTSFSLTYNNNNPKTLTYENNKNEDRNWKEHGNFGDFVHNSGTVDGMKSKIFSGASIPDFIVADITNYINFQSIELYVQIGQHFISGKSKGERGEYKEEINIREHNYPLPFFTYYLNKNTNNHIELEFINGNINIKNNNILIGNCEANSVERPSLKCKKSENS